MFSYLANLVGKVMDKIMEFQIFLPLENYTKRSNSMDFGLKNNGLCHAHLQAQPGQRSEKGVGQDHGVTYLDFLSKVQRDKS